MTIQLTPRAKRSRLTAAFALRVGALVSLLYVAGCAGGQGSKWPPTAQKWFDRATYSYEHGDLEDARLASDNALAALPNEPKVRVLAAEVALAELEFERSLKLLEALPGSEAAGLRGRAHWYLGNIDQAAEELAVLTADPEIKDEWAKQTLKLARSGRGRTPFEMTGLVAAVDMPFAGASMLVPVEVNGEPSLAMVATDRAETVIDSKSGIEGGWISLRFAGQLEVSDVPAVAQDLSGLSREIGAPIRMLIGVHLLRRIHATIDVAGRQFVARNYEPPAPPEATTVNPIFYRGGAMVLPGAFSVEKDAPVSTLLVNTSMAFPLALDEAGWKKAGQDITTFAAVPGAEGLKHGSLPMLRLGAFEIPNVPGVLGAPVKAVEKETGIDIDGFAGAGLFSTFRLTFADRGRILWMEDLPPDVIELRREVARMATRPRAPLAPLGSPPSAPPMSAPPMSAPPQSGGAKDGPPPSPADKAAP